MANHRLDSDRYAGAKGGRNQSDDGRTVVDVIVRKESR